MRTGSCGRNSFRADETKFDKKVLKLKIENSRNHAISLGHLIWAGRKWQNGNTVYREFCLAIRDFPGKMYWELFPRDI